MLFPSPDIPEENFPESGRQEIKIIMEADAALSEYLIENTGVETGTKFQPDAANLSITYTE